MSKVLVRPRVVIGLILSIVLFGGAWGAAQMQPAARSAPAIELKCKILGNPDEHTRGLWLVELRNAAGAPLRQVLRMVGDTVHFKDLVPGIYRIYLSGRGGRRSCESVDLTPAPNQRSLAIAKEIRVPKSAAQVPGQYQVSVHNLTVPKEALQQLQRSEKAQLEGDEEEVMRRLKRAIEIYPAYADAWNNLGAHYHRKGDFAQSIQSFTKVTELSPDFYVGWMNLGGSLLATGRFKGAVEANRKALSLGPDDAIANSQLGLSHYYLHEYGEAKKYFKRVLALDPAFANSPHLFLAHIAMGERSFVEAMGYLRGYLELHPNAPDAPRVKQTLMELAEGLIITEQPIRR
ncbi:MAG: tetratricopeptide repeat protein [Acidobacteriia bacterium]|nr:tetratricopeptide repeat protein [Terriglobia bacterium]